MNDASDHPDDQLSSSVPPAAAPDAPRADPADLPPGSPDGTDPPARPRKKWIAAAAAALGVALFTSALLSGPGSDHDDAGAFAKAGDEKRCARSKGAADLGFTLQDMNGANVRLSDYKGKVVLLNFWATWCGPCKVEIPEFVEAYSHYRDRGFVILGVLSQDDPTPEDLREFTRAFKMNYPVLRQNEPLEDAFGSLWALPTSFIIDRNGSICTKHMGPVSREMLEREIKGLL